jgi:GT2 family glycosyltransferase
MLHASRAEILPLVVIEALACETPVVASDSGGVCELVRDAETGRSFAPGDAEGAAAALARSLDRPDEATALAVRGGRVVREECDHERVVDRLLDWFAEAIEADARRTGQATGHIPHYGVRGALVGRVEAEVRRRPIPYRIARRLRHAPRIALHLASRAARRAGLAPRLGQLAQYEPRPLEIPASYDAAPEPLAHPPVVSIVTPSLDHGRFLERTLASVADQGYPALEHVVRDGGSHDETPAILAAWADRLHDVVSAPDGGQAPALNRGFERTSGEIMAWLNADDVLLPGALHYVARHFSLHPDVDVVYGHRVLIDSDDREIGRWIVPAHDPEVLRWADFVPQETLFWRRRAWEKTGAHLDESFHFAMDWDLLLRFARAGLSIERLPRFLGGFRVHAAQKTRAWEALGAAEMDRLRLRELGFLPRPDQIHRRLWRYSLRHLRLHAAWRMGLARF